MAAVSEDSFLAEVLSMVKGPGQVEPHPFEENDNGEEGDEDEDREQQPESSKRARRDENEELDPDTAMQRVEEMRKKTSAASSKFAAFSFAKK